MPVKITTGRVEQRYVNNILAAVKVIATPEFASDAMDIQDTGDKVLKYLQNIFPVSPASYPRFGRPSLVSGWRKFPHPPLERSFGKHVGFTIRRQNSNQRDHEIIAALDQGTQPYTRIVPKGKRTRFIQTNFNPLYVKSEIGDKVFVTGNGLLFKYRARRGLGFMGKTFVYAQGLMTEARGKFKSAARRKVLSAKS